MRTHTGVSYTRAAPHAQVCESLKVLLDPDTMDTSPEKNEFLDVFYEKYMDTLTDVILR